MPKADPDNYPSDPRDRCTYESEDGTTHVILLDALFWCPTCGKHLPASQVGFRKMPDGTLRDQNNCHEHRQR
jgi:hypothetical protein